MTTRLRRIVKPAAALAAIAVLSGAGYQGWLLHQHYRSGVAAREALDAGTQYAEILTTANPGTIDRQITRILDGSTGKFHDRYAKQSSDLRALLLANQVTTRGSVVNSAVKSADARSATVLLFVQQTFSSAKVKGAPGDPPADVTPMAITLQKVGGRWLASDVAAAELNP
ncbi:Mce protein [[Mycobacterium] zoologicum]|nr:Mce protein [Mycolicibacter sp. MYC101]